jgi:hypothetical protein
MGGSGKVDRNWAFALSPRERPDQDVSELVYELLDNELEYLQDASRTSLGAILRSLTSWTCLFKPNEVRESPLLNVKDAVTKFERRGGYLGESPIGTALKLMCVFLPHLAASLLDKHLGYKGSIACLISKRGETTLARDASR